MNCVMVNILLKLIGRGAASAKGRDHPSRRASKLQQSEPFSKFNGQLL